MATVSHPFDFVQAQAAKVLRVAWADLATGDPNNNDFIQNHARVMMGQQVPQEDFVSTAWENYYKGFEAGYEAGKVAALGQIPTPSGAWPPVVKIN